MNFKIFGITTLAAMLAFASTAGAKDHRLPDGTVISVIHDGTTNIVRGNSLTTVVSECRGAPKVCTTVKVDTATTPGLLSGVPQALVSGLSLIKAAQSLRPANTEVYNDSYSQAQGGDASASAYIDQSRPIYHQNYFDGYYNYQPPMSCLGCKG